MHRVSHRPALSQHRLVLPPGIKSAPHNVLALSDLKEIDHFLEWVESSFQYADTNVVVRQHNIHLSNQLTSAAALRRLEGCAQCRADPAQPGRERQPHYCGECKARVAHRGRRRAGARIGADGCRGRAGAV